MDNNEPLTTSQIVSEQLKRTHKSIMNLVNAHKKDFEEFGTLSFSKGKSTGGRPIEFVYLNEQQLTFLIMNMKALKKDGDRVLDFKKLITKEMDKRTIGEYFNLNDRDIKDTISTSKYLYDNDKHSFLKLYLIELGQVLNGKKTNLYIFPATIEIANIVFEKEKDLPVDKIYKILEKEISKYLDLYFKIPLGDD